jgi:phosphinothricin acetyltransferase
VNAGGSSARAQLAIRQAREDDASAIAAIYNHYIATSTCTFATAVEDEAQRRAWLGAHDDGHPATVAELGHEIVGWAALSAYRARPAYRHTVEISVYVRHDHHGRGIGRTLLVDLIARARTLGHHSIVACIAADQAPSLALHARCGFVETGRLRDAGRKFERWLDVVFMQLML